MSKKVLIIEDEAKIRRVIKDYLMCDDINILEAEDGIKGIELFEKNKIDLIILDIMIPGLDGWSVCEKIRQKSDVMIVMLTAKSEEGDKLLGYELGADDYITKPFSPRVLRAKINALLSRIDKSKENKEQNQIFIYKHLNIDLKARKVFVKDKEMNLASKEYNLLVYLLSNKNIALAREQILDKIWGIDFNGLDRTVDTTIKRLRAKIGNEVLPIKAVRGYGYRFEVKE
ncbi:response regulator transcription factor [Clostridium ganghwense]|uniref:Stage 0 sporulation protein A homolog n=1 Tax=Clostridium ganghwense TaxID=312089 RepID=A0ABT4CJ22_9CLOT|nr:response regulator transcription factor [Clostridium ganghwense]MCY6369055.1 response regulator transcription factor [Clostridium ganghwense]